MSDDPSTSISHGSRDAGAARDGQPAVGQAVPGSESEAWSYQRARTSVQNKKRMEFLDSLMRNLDILIYCEFSILYYMEYELSYGVSKP